MTDTVTQRAMGICIGVACFEMRNDMSLKNECIFKSWNKLCPTDAIGFMGLASMAVVRGDIQEAKRIMRSIPADADNLEFAKSFENKVFGSGTNRSGGKSRGPASL